MFITCLGLSGSGKTVFLGSLLDCLHSPANARGGFYIIDRNTKGGAIMEDTLDHEKISLQANLHDVGSGGFTGYPGSTSGTVRREFSLIHGKETVLNVDWLDYKGGLINHEVKDDGSRDLLYGNIAASTAVVIFLDAYQIATSQSVQQARRRVGIDSISKIMSHFEIEKENEVVNILVVLTQCDAVEDVKWIGEGDYVPLKQYAQEVLGGFVDMVHRNARWNCGMVAVSAVGVGRNRRIIITEAAFNKLAQTRDELIDEPVPENIVEAFYWLVACEVTAQKETSSQRISRLNRRKEIKLRNLVDGVDEVREQLLDEEQKRVRELGFFRRCKEAFSKGPALARLLEEQQRRVAEHEAEVSAVISDVEREILSEQENLLRFEMALKPLIAQANVAVSRV